MIADKERPREKCHNRLLEIWTRTSVVPAFKKYPFEETEQQDAQNV